MGALLEARLNVATPEALAAAHYPNGKLGGLTVPGKPPGALGQRVALTISCARPHRQFTIEGQLAWARHKAGVGGPSGFGVDFLPDDDVPARVLAFARGELDSRATRSSTRHLVSLQVKLVHAGLPRKEWIADLSAGGAFIRTWNPLPIGAPVQVFLRTPLALTSLEVPAQVAWQRVVGQDPGMGLEFIAPPELRARLEKWLGRLVG